MSKTGTIIPPELPDTIPSHSQWLLGQGAGVWFCIDKTNNNKQFRIRRFSPDGELDCDRTFEIEKTTPTFNTNKPYQFKHISHCAKCRIEQNKWVFVFNWIGQENK